MGIKNKDKLMQEIWKNLNKPISKQEDAVKIMSKYLVDEKEESGERMKVVDMNQSIDIKKLEHLKTQNMIKVKKEDMDAISRLIVMEKVLQKEEITKADVESLGMFNDMYINKMFEAGQEEVRRQLAKAFGTPGMIEVKADDTGN